MNAIVAVNNGIEAFCLVVFSKKPFSLKSKTTVDQTKMF